MNAPRATTIPALLAAMVRNHGARPAILDGEAVLTFRELDALSARIASGLDAAGIGHGDCVAAVLVNSAPMIALYYACARLGAIFTPLNWRLAPPELAHCLGDAEPKLLFVSARFRDLVEKTASPIPKIFVPEVGEPDDGFEAFLAQGSGHSGANPVLPDAPLIILYTSGTTGRSKGCVLSQQGQFLATLASLAFYRASPADRVLLAAPLFHVGGLSLLQTFLAAGASVVLPPRDANVETLHGLLSRTACTVTSLAPLCLAPLMERQRNSPLPLKLRHVVVGGGMHDRQFLQSICDSLGAEPIGGYGQSECGNFVAYLRGDEQLAKLSACGQPLLHLETRIVDEQDRPLPPGEAGELQVRGSSVMLGYWNNAAATNAAFTAGGWLHTGDVMRIDAEGFLHFAGRIKELIKTGGENVYPLEVEQALLAHPAIAEVCVFGVPDARWGEAVKAAIVLKPGMSLGAQEVVAWCRERIAGYKRPRYVEFIERMPRDFNGKLGKKELAARPLTAEQKTD